MASSPEKTYAKNMEAALTQLDAFNTKLQEWDKVTTTVIPSHKDLTYGQALSLFPQLIETYNISKQAGMEYNYEPYVAETQKTLTPLAQSISKEGFSTLTILKSITPPDAVKFPHEQVATCVQYKVDLMNEIAALLENMTNSTQQLPSDQCGNFENAILTIQAFVNANK